MRKLSGLFCLLAIFPLTLAAQDYRKIEVFGGYSHLRDFGVGSLHFNGGSGAITFNAKQWIGVTGDFGGYGNTEKFLGGPDTTTTNKFTYLFGPTLTYRGYERASPFFHVLSAAYTKAAIYLALLPSASRSPHPRSQAMHSLPPLAVGWTSM